MKCTIITDIHYGPDRGTKKGTAALVLLQEFKDFLERNPTGFIVEMGDRISDVDRETDIKNLKDISNFFRELPFDKHHILGNHDVAAMSIAENEEVMGCSFSSYSFEKDGITVVIWNANTVGYNQNGFSIPQSQIDWLENELKNVSYPAIIFTHAPLDSGSMVGNFYFEADRFVKSGYPLDDAKKIRDVIEKSEKVVLCLNGHTHWNKYNCIDGVHYVTIPSLTETFMTYPKAHKAWAELVIDKTIQIKIYGEGPVFYELPIKIKDSHWINKDKPYSPVKELPQ